MRTLFDYITGTLVQKEANRIVLDVGGVGFDVQATSMTTSALLSIGEVVTVHTYLVVREDSLSIYGFESVLERTLFIQLLGISGIGPRLAIAALSVFSPAELVQIIKSNNETELCKVAGIGKKTAQRIILELRDKIDDTLVNSAATIEVSSSADMAVAALQGLGYTEEEIRYGLEKAEATADTAQRVRNALDALRKR